jgi:hypothetical protein
MNTDRSYLGSSDLTTESHAELLEAAKDYMRKCPADEDQTRAFQAATDRLRRAITACTGTEQLENCPWRARGMDCGNNLAAWCGNCPKHDQRIGR